MKPKHFLTCSGLIFFKWIAWFVSIPAFAMFVIQSKVQTLVTIKMEAEIWNLRFPYLVNNS